MTEIQLTKVEKKITKLGENICNKYEYQYIKDTLRIHQSSMKKKQSNRKMSKVYEQAITEEEF